MLVSPALLRRLLVPAIVLATATRPALAAAQSAADHIALGDREHAAMNAPSALQHYEEAIKLDPKIVRGALEGGARSRRRGRVRAAGGARLGCTRSRNNTRGAPSRRTRETRRDTSISRARSDAGRSRSASAIG